MTSDHLAAVMTDAATVAVAVMTTVAVEATEAALAMVEVTGTVEIANHEVVAVIAIEATVNATTMATEDVLIAMPLVAGTAPETVLVTVLEMVPGTVHAMVHAMTDTPAAAQTARTTVEEEEVVVVAEMTVEDQPTAVAMHLHLANLMEAAEAEASTTAVMTGTHVDEDLH